MFVKLRCCNRCGTRAHLQPAAAHHVLFLRRCMPTQPLLAVLPSHCSNQTGSVGTGLTQTHFNHRFMSHTTSLSGGETRQARTPGCSLRVCSSPGTHRAENTQLTDSSRQAAPDNRLLQLQAAHILLEASLQPHGL